MQSIQNLLKREVSPKTSLLIMVIILVPILSLTGYLSMRQQPISMSDVSLEFVPMGDVDQKQVQSIAVGVATRYGVPYKVTQPVPLPRSAFDPVRRQYNADRLNAELE